MCGARDSIGPMGPKGTEGPMGPMSTKCPIESSNKYNQISLDKINEITKKYDQKIELLEQEIKNLKLEITELHLKPPNEGGKLYESAKTHFESFDLDKEQS
jgi:hypothetical protein